MRRTALVCVYILRHYMFFLFYWNKQAIGLEQMQEED